MINLTENLTVERHNATIKHMLEKIMEETPLVGLEIAVQWAVHAKNSLANVHGFSPAQLTLGHNPEIPTVLNNKPPAMEERDSDDIIMEHLQAMKLARREFIKAETSEKLKRALRHNIRPSVKNIYVPGDLVYYKRKDFKKMERSRQGNLY